MTTEITDAALERFLSGPAPYGSGNPAPTYQTAQQDLADALEGQAPHFSKTIATEAGPMHTAELAKVIRRAVAVGIRRRAEQETADRMHGAYELLVAGLNQVTDGCSTPEDEGPDRG